MLVYEGLRMEVLEDVYEPAEDSFLLADYARTIKGEILEIGCGSGIVSLVAASADKDNHVIGVDISSSAIKNSNIRIAITGFAWKGSRSMKSLAQQRKP